MAARRKLSLLSLLCLLTSVLLACVGLFLQSRVRTAYQYMIAAPEEPSRITQLYERAESLEAIVSTRRQHAFLDGETVTLYGVDAQWQRIHHDTLYAGRMISARDVQRKTPCIVLSESTARGLFPSGEALGSMVNLDGCLFEVAGLIRDADFAGEADAAVAYIPVTAEGIRMDTVTCSVPTDAQSTPSAICESKFLSWSSGGTFHDFARLRFSAWMPFYLTAVLALAGLLCWGIRRYFAWGKLLFQQTQSDLRTQYLRVLWPRFALRGLLGAAVTAGVIAALWCWLRLLVYPMGIFSDWVPENPAKLSSWLLCIRQIFTSAAAGVVCSSRETTCMNAAASICTISYALLMTAVGMQLCRNRASHIFRE